MQIGDPSYKRCPHCGVNNEYYQGPFFVKYYGLTEWSDGKTFQELPRLEKSKLQKCKSCSQYYWFTQNLGGMSFEDYVEAFKYFQEKYSQKTIVNIIFHFRNRRRLLYLSLKILRSYNDSIREHPLNYGARGKTAKSEDERIKFEENAKLLIPLLKAIEPNNHLLIAEVYRNLGDFKSAENEIQNIKDKTVKELILTQIQNKNRDVVIIKSPSETKHHRQ